MNKYHKTWKQVKLDQAKKEAEKVAKHHKTAMEIIFEAIQSSK